MAGPTRSVTEVDAVSEMLQAVGLMSVSAISAPNAVVARDELQRQWRSILIKDWWFNSRRKFTVSPAADKTITVPPEVLHLDDTKDTDNLIIVDGKLYSKEDNSNEFDDDVDLSVTITVDFPDGPFVAQDFAIKKATGVFARGRMGNPNLARAFRDDIALAWAELVRMDTLMRDTNLFNNPALNMQRRQPATGLHAR